jgi:hypothetical protein
MFIDGQPRFVMFRIDGALQNVFSRIGSNSRGALGDLDRRDRRADINASGTEGAMVSAFFPASTVILCSVGRPGKSLASSAVRSV